MDFCGVGKCGEKAARDSVAVFHWETHRGCELSAVHGSEHARYACVGLSWSSLECHSTQEDVRVRGFEEEPVEPLAHARDQINSIDVSPAAIRSGD